MLLNLTELSSEPLHEQISRQVAEKITMDELAAGSVLLPANTLAREQRVSVNTVKRPMTNSRNMGLSKQNRKVVIIFPN